MKYCILNFIVFFYSIASFGQEVEDYTFDYCAIYTLKNKSSEAVLKRYIIGNSKDGSYFAYILTTPTDTILDMALNDQRNVRHYQFNVQRKHIKEISSFAELTQDYKLFKASVSNKNDKNYVYDFQNLTANNEKVLEVKVFKNESRNKLVAKYHYYLEDNKLFTNQFQTSRLLLSREIPTSKTNNEGVLLKQVAFEVKSDTALETNELNEINPLDLNIKLKTAPSLTLREKN
jgi:hypothetical protein